MATRVPEPERLHTELTAHGFVIGDDRWVWDPEAAGVEMVFKALQRDSGLDRVMRDLMTFPLQWKRWKPRHKSLLAGIRREARERRCPPSQALWLVYREASAKVSPTIRVQMKGMHPTKEEVDAWAVEMRTAIDREVARILCGDAARWSREVPVGEDIDTFVAAPVEGEAAHALESLLADPRWTPCDRALLRALSQTGGSLREAARLLGMKMNTAYKRRKRLRARRQAG